MKNIYKSPTEQSTYLWKSTMAASGQDGSLFPYLICRSDAHSHYQVFVHTSDYAYILPLFIFIFQEYYKRDKDCGRQNSFYFSQVILWLFYLVMLDF